MKIKDIKIEGTQIDITLTDTYSQQEYLAASGFAAKDIPVDIVAHKNRRSLDANAYFHILVGRIADVLKMSKPRCKNWLMGRYGQRETDSKGRPVEIAVIDTVDMLEREDIHCIPVGYMDINGEDYTRYAVVRGTHTYDSKEMHILISGTVDDAADIGIETLTPDEIARLTGYGR